MKKLLLLMLGFCSYYCYCQNKYSSLIDSFCNKLDQQDDYYTADQSPRFFDSDSNYLGFVSDVYYYFDQRGRKLYKVNRLNQTSTDSSSICYYFKKGRLVKVDARVLKHTEFLQQNFYFKRGKLVYATPIENSPFDPNHYLLASKDYLKYRAKMYFPSVIRDRF
jgi:hypothetical protein